MRRVFVAYRGDMFFDPRHRLQMAEAHADALRRVGPRRVPAPEAGRDRAAADSTIVIRSNRPDDARALARLAGLDSARVPHEPVLLAEVGGELHAALSLHDGAVIADPFHYTVQLVTLLQTRAEQLLATDRSARRRWFARVRSRLAPAR